MSERLHIFLPLEHGPILIIENTRRSSPLGSPHMRCLPLLRWHHVLARCLTTTLLLKAWFLLVRAPIGKTTTRTKPVSANTEWDRNSTVSKGKGLKEENESERQQRLLAWNINGTILPSCTMFPMDLIIRWTMRTSFRNGLVIDQGAAEYPWRW